MPGHIYSGQRILSSGPLLRMKKLLPILVVILLLIGLIGALLSSFFFPGPSGSTGIAQPDAPTSWNSDSTAFPSANFLNGTSRNRPFAEYVTGSSDVSFSWSYSIDFEFVKQT